MSDREGRVPYIGATSCGSMKKTGFHDGLEQMHNRVVMLLKRRAGII